MIAGNIDSDPKWEWASSKACRGPMDEAHAKLNALIKDSALSQDMIVASDINDLKVGKDASSLAGSLNHIVATFQPAVKSLATQCRMLLPQQKARESAASDCS